jgi:uracil-DNA glycosylase
MLQIYKIIMTIQDLQKKLYDKLEKSGWGDKLKIFLLSDDFGKILTELYKDTQNGKRFTPSLKDVFRAFEECPYDKLKVVIIGMDPYVQIGVADGIAFSCSKSEKPQPSLRFLLQNVDDTLYASHNTPIHWDLDLKRWSNQGVLLLNTALTCEIGNTGSHINLWKPFIVTLLDSLNSYNTGIIYVFLGNKAKEWHGLINSATNYKFFATHPATAAYKNAKKWDSGNLFVNLNTLLIKLYNEPIIW